MVANIFYIELEHPPPLPAPTFEMATPCLFTKQYFTLWFYSFKKS